MTNAFPTSGMIRKTAFALCWHFLLFSFFILSSFSMSSWHSNRLNSNVVAMAPAPILPRLPRWLNHWLGYRPTPPKPLPQYLVWLWSFFAAFCGLCVLQAIFNYSSYFNHRHVPGIVASFVSGWLFASLRILPSVRAYGRDPTVLIILDICDVTMCKDNWWFNR